MSINAELNKYIQRHASDKYDWGDKDCMLFPSRWIDTYYGLNTSRGIEGQYYNRRTALVFYKNYLSVEGVLKHAGFVEQADISSVEDGDLIQTGTLEWPLIWITYNDCAYCMSEQGLIFVTFEALSDQVLKVWRR